MGKTARRSVHAAVVTMVPAALSAGDEHEVDTLEGLSREPDGCRCEGCGVRRLA